MVQLTKREITDITEEIKKNQYVRSMKTHPWVLEDGVYEHHDHALRVFIWSGFGYMVASRSWIEDPIANKRLPTWMQAPWDTYPPLPPKPPKKS